MQECCTKLHELVGSGYLKLGRRLNLLPDIQSDSPVIKGVVVISQRSGRSNPGKLTTLRLFSSCQVDHDTGKGRLSAEASFGNGKNTQHGDAQTMTYHISFILKPDFGVAGALAVKNSDRHEFFLRSVTLQESAATGSRHIHFDCNSWVYPFNKTNEARLFFSNTSYLSMETPPALRELREEELMRLRGDGRGERKEWERVYAYDRYNDLGEPNKGPDNARTVLGGSKEYPYPRRVRTGRPLRDEDRITETRHRIINLDFYVPPDERFSPSKLSDFISNSIQAIVHFVIPEVKSLFEGDIDNFESFDQMIKDLYAGDRSRFLEGMVMERLKDLIPEELFKEVVRVIKENPLKFPVPQVIANDKSAWKSDEEFGREMLAGINPVVIKCLKTFPPVGRDGKKSSISASHIVNSLDGLTVAQAMSQWRIFILDHHDYLMPYLRRINAQGVCMYASRTLLFLQNDSTLKPLAIELSLPSDTNGNVINRVFVSANQGIEAALWQLAKTHVAANDSGYHQLISHWLHTHAAVEPFIIATRRQLSSMHPIHKLLEPHFKDTMHINSLVRSVLLNSGGVLERTMFPGKFSMELSSSLYKNWQFHEQALPADLLKRRMATEDPDHPSGVRLLFEDYPYAVDGLEVWVAIKNWVTAFCTHFYPPSRPVSSDTELKSWWSEIRRIGHGDLESNTSWLPLDTLPNLISTLTTLIWIASALHAAVNFGQWGYAGYLPNRPPRCRRFVPEEGTPEFAEMVRDPDRYFMRTMPDRFTATLGLALIEVLSGHAGDEVYLGRRAEEEWTDDGEVVRMFREFGEELRRVEMRIEVRNGDARLRNRRGAVRMAYTLMYPDVVHVEGKGKGISGKGIPNSVSM